MKRHRGAVRKATSTYLGVWLPNHFAEAVDQAVLKADSDKSKFVRAALKEKLAREQAV